MGRRPIRGLASRLVMAAVDLRTVQELLRHKVIAMTVRYAHLAPKHTLAAVERLDKPTETSTDSATDSRAFTTNFASTDGVAVTDRVR